MQIANIGDQEIKRGSDRSIQDIKWFEKNVSIKKDSRTRGHEVTLVKDQCRLDVRKYSFSQRTINEWNRLPADCVGA